MSGCSKAEAGMWDRVFLHVPPDSILPAPGDRAWCPVPSWLGLQPPAHPGISALMGCTPREGIASGPLP